MISLFDRNKSLSQAAANLEEMLYGIHRKENQEPLTKSEIKDVEFEVERIKEALEGYPAIEGDI